MLLEKLQEAFLGKIVDGLIELAFEKKDNKNSINEKSISEEETRLLIKQQISNEFKLLDQNNTEIKLLDSIRNSFIQRIHNIFQVFDVNIEEVPVFLKKFNITHKDTLYEENLLEKFNDDVINYISTILDINKDWIYGRTNEMISMDGYGFYKRSSHFCQEILKTNPSTIYILTDSLPNKETDEKNHTNRMYIVVEYTKQNLSNRTIYTYKIFNDTCHYGYWRCRYEIKRFFLCMKKSYSNRLLKGFATPNISEKIYKFSEGKIKFDNIWKNASVWYPDDYVDFPSESACSKKEELDELKQIAEEYDKIHSY
jgi:hypothetical protein